MRRATALVRRAAEQDGAALHALICDHAEFEQATATISSGQLRTILSAAEPPVRLLVAEKDAELIGYAAVTIDFSVWRGSRWAHLDCLFVRAEARGQSIGPMLMQAAVSVGRECGADRLEWQTPDWNERAAAFYRREGASELPKRRFALVL